MDDKIRLMSALVEAEKEAEMYKGLFNKAKAAVSSIKSDLDNMYQPEGSRYTSDELTQCRRAIVNILASGWMAPREITDRLHNHCADLVMREVHKLAENPRSAVTWNHRMGPASRYMRATSSVVI